MESDTNFITYLLVTPSKLMLSINDKFDNKILFQKEKILDNNLIDANELELIRFLEENILNLEKKLKNFIKSIHLIFESEKFFTVNISVNKRNYNQKISIDILTYLLNDARNQCRKTIHGKKIIHMLIDNYHVDKKDYSYFPKDRKYNNLALDVRFICLPQNDIKNLEEIFEKYQISIKKILSFKYMQNFFKNEKIDIITMSHRIINGSDQNEVKLVSKINQKRGFFEKFFDFFS
tara:strand:- start:15 stop:719 length:705 start_codon:yes stop_codon:yes gene_type:complete